MSDRVESKDYEPRNVEADSEISDSGDRFRLVREAARAVTVFEETAGVMIKEIELAYTSDGVLPKRVVFR